jgi:hypothetical protein
VCNGESLWQDGAGFGTVAEQKARQAALAREAREAEDKAAAEKAAANRVVRQHIHLLTTAAETAAVRRSAVDREESLLQPG